MTAPTNSTMNEEPQDKSTDITEETLIVIIDNSASCPPMDTSKETHVFEYLESSGDHIKPQIQASVVPVDTD